MTFVRRGGVLCLQTSSGVGAVPSDEDFVGQQRKQDRPASGRGHVGGGVLSSCVSMYLVVQDKDTYFEVGVCWKSVSVRHARRGSFSAWAASSDTAAARHLPTQEFFNREDGP